MKTSRHQNLARRKRRIERRLRPRTWPAQATPMYRASNIQYEHSDRVRGLASGGIGAMHRLAQHTGLVDAIDRARGGVEGASAVSRIGSRAEHRVQRAVRRDCLEDIELRRQDEVYLDALGAQRIPDPTTAGDFCRRFDEAAIEALQAAINETRVRVWRAQPAAFFEEAVIDVDGTWPRRPGSARKGWTSLTTGCGAITRWWCRWPTRGEPLYLVNRSGNRPSSEGAAARFDQARALCAGRGVSPDHLARRYRFQPDGAPGSLGCRRRPVRVRVRRARQSDRPGRRVAGRARGRAWCGARRTRSRPSRASGP